jgi:hypothetical protein
MKSPISHRGGAENAEEIFSIKKSSELCELCVSAVKSYPERSPGFRIAAVRF